jgi:small nuclear ribonucleoprotein (snRNP)-like protein
MVKKNSWVQIEKVILTPSQRLSSIPNDTKNTPLMMWVKGFLLDDANIGDTVQIKTKTGRLEEGKLIKVNPSYNHSFGDYVEEFAIVDEIVLKAFHGDNYE